MRSAWDRVWIVIPAFDEAATIRVLAEAALALCPRVVVVDDGSRDGTAERVADLPLTLLRHDENRGKAASLRSAFAHALRHDAEAAITLDGDGQHDPADLPRLLAAWRAHPGRMVIGSRLHDRAAFPPSRWFGNRFACFWISWAAGHTIADSQTGLRVYPRSVMTLALDGGAPSDRFTFESEILIEAARRGIHTVSVPIESRYEEDRRASHFRPLRDVSRITRMIAWRLIRGGFMPRNYWRARTVPPVIVETV